MLTHISGFSAESITPLMILAGFGMVMGNLISGRLSDRYTPGKVGTAAQALICLMLLLIFFLSPYKWAAALLMCLCTAGLFAVSSPEQILIIRVAKGGEMLGAACVQVAFNLGNAIGGLCRRTGSQRRIPLSRPDGCSVCIDRLHPIPDLL